MTESIKVPSAKAGAAPTVFTEKVVLDALFGFDSDGILLNLHVHSSGILSDGKLDNLRQLVDPHRAWTDLQVGNALKKAGAQFEPSDHDALMRTLPRDALEQALGPFKVDSLEFRLRHQQPSGSLAELYWELIVSSTTTTGKRLRWSLTLEPFTDRVADIVRFLQDRPESRDGVVRKKTPVWSKLPEQQRWQLAAEGHLRNTGHL